MAMLKITRCVNEPVSDTRLIKWQVIIPTAVIDALEKELAPPDHLVFQLIPQEYATLIEACYICVYPGILAPDGWQIMNFWEGFMALSSLIAQQLPNPAIDHLLTLTQAQLFGQCGFSIAEIPLIAGLRLYESQPSQENVQAELHQAVQQQRCRCHDDYEVKICEAEPDLIVDLTDDESEEADESEVYMANVVDEEE
ncbi:hypothetical protein M422DRAFT_244021 [Sphaerobolus stellatus SS14]|nr:hypothetical protein M422DRAFT_244021 [Sphaerobolus stellatus SS14]